MTPMKLPKRGVPAGLRRTLAVVAISAVAVAGWQLNANSLSEIGVIGIPGATAEPTGPPGPTGPGGMDGSQFQPPGLPPQQPDYGAGSNLPPLNQEGGASIYNTGTQGAPQQTSGQQSPRQGNQDQQAQHGTQIPDYQSATPYTQGPGKANPDFQAPQQGNQGQQPQQGQQPSQQQQPNHQDQQQGNQNKQCDTSVATPANLQLLGLESLPPQVRDLVQQAAGMWKNTGMANISTDGNGQPSGSGQNGTPVSVTTFADQSIPWAGMYMPSIDGSAPRIELNLSRLSNNPAGDAAFVAHEIGHALGLPDTADGQIMDHSGATRALDVTAADRDMLANVQSGCETGPASYGPEYGCGYVQFACDIGQDIGNTVVDAAKSAADFAADWGKCALEVGTLVVPMFKVLKIGALLTKMLKSSEKMKDAQKMVDATKAFMKLFGDTMSNKNLSWMDKAKEVFKLVKIFMSDHDGGEAVVKLFGSITGISSALVACKIMTE
ncbi:MULTISPECIES: hypothetical protein [unclassified Mycobacteroides]|uniref:hypothetical protein n=1 Tax=unclassified Mycobacteroides TaxID=2618759 RepID=UPI001EF12964